MVGRWFVNSLGYTRTIVFDDQRSLSVASRQSNYDLSGVSVPDRVVHGLLGNPIKMGGHDGVVDEDRTIAMELARDAKDIFHFNRPPPKRGHQALRLRHHGEKTMRQLPRFVDGLIYQLDDPGRFRGLLQSLLCQLLFLHFAHESNPG